MRYAVKICGLCSCEDVRAIAQMVPDAMGFVFWEKSPRCVRPEEVAEWSAHISPRILKVGVFVDASEDVIRQTVQIAGLDAIQLHGFQSLEKMPARFPEIGKAANGLPTRVWAAVHIGRNEKIAMEKIEFVDVFVADSGTEVIPGGTGRACDWDGARRFVEQCPKPVLLAGGLTPRNIREALDRVRPWGVDVSSGVEREIRRKDLPKVEQIIAACRL